MASHQIDPRCRAMPRRYSVPVATKRAAGGLGWAIRDFSHTENSHGQDCQHGSWSAHAYGARGRLDLSRPRSSCRGRIDIAGGLR